MVTWLRTRCALSLAVHFEPSDPTLVANRLVRGSYVGPGSALHVRSIAAPTWHRQDTRGQEKTANRSLFCPGWDTILPKWDMKGHQWTSKWCPVSLWSRVRPTEGSSSSFWGAEWPKNQLTVPRADPGQFRDSRRLWYTRSYRFSALQGWRHGVRSRSLGGMCRHLPQYRP